ncbi:MAG: hypothetical protein RID91_16665, partial [Azospirillaceae bacterium]
GLDAETAARRFGDLLAAFAAGRAPEPVSGPGAAGRREGERRASATVAWRGVAPDDQGRGRQEGMTA